MAIAIYPGSFDPVTFGHLDIIRRGAQCFEKVVVCVLVNSKKQGLFSPEERVEFIRRVTTDIPNVEVETSSKLLAEYAKERNIKVVLKGLRGMADFESEVQMATINRTLNPELDTMFLPSSQTYTFLSSTVVKEMVRYGVDLKQFLPEEIIEDVKKKAEESGGAV